MCPSPERPRPDRAGRRVGRAPAASPAVNADPDPKSASLKQLRRIEGQVRGIAAMVGSDRSCAEIVTQVSAVRESLRTVARSLVRRHLRHCAAALRSDEESRDRIISEVLEIVGRIAR